MPLPKNGRAKKRTWMPQNGKEPIQFDEHRRRSRAARTRQLEAETPEERAIRESRDALSGTLGAPHMS